MHCARVAINTQTHAHTDSDAHFNRRWCIECRHENRQAEKERELLKGNGAERKRTKKKNQEEELEKRKKRIEQRDEVVAKW